MNLGVFGRKMAISCGILSMLFKATTFQLPAQTNQNVYADSLQNGWVNWSWATVSLTNPSPVHGGTYSISVSSTNWQALYLHHTAQDAAQFASLTFWVNGGASGGQSVQVQATRGGAAQVAVVLAPLPASVWRQDTVSLSSLGVATTTDFDGFWLQVQNSGLAPTFYVDDITLVAGTNTPVTNTSVTISVDAFANRHSISPLIYGVAFAASNQLSDLNCPLNRSGGNSETRYNWQLNAHNHAADWYFESIDDGITNAGASGDDFVANSKNGGAQAMLTVSMIGWAPKLTPSRGKLASYSIAKYGLQAGNDWQWMPDAGDGIVTNTSTPIITNSPYDANFPTNSSFQKAWLEHLTNRWGLSTNGGVRYYLMDNEHSIWHSTHQDVHPVGASMQEIRDRIFDYAGKVKSVDPAALVAAPEEWGWSGYFYSGFDQQYGSQHNWSSFPDRATNGGWDYLPWLLDQFRQRATNTNQRLVDYFTVHYYPQGNEFGSDTSSAIQLLRNRSTRSLWDTNYLDASWINSVVMLIPRLKGWVAAYYPGTKIGITEYNWGGETSINGATAQADILGIFGREGLDLATRWTTPDPSTPTYNAIKLYRNYDSAKSCFGDTSVSASVPNADNVSAFAAVRSTDGALTVMVINKQLGATATAGSVLTNFLPAGIAQEWQLSSANTITRLSDFTFSGTSITNSLPAQSVTLLVLPAGAPPQLRVGSLSATNTFDLWLDGQPGLRYTIQASTDLITWAPVQTNTLAASSLHLVLPATTAQRFYRAKWAP